MRPTVDEASTPVKLLHAALFLIAMSQLLSICPKIPPTPPLVALTAPYA